jgi:hypothetical protein
MGCGGSRIKLEGMDEPLNYCLHSDFGIEDADNYFKEVANTIQNIEKVREYFVDRWEELAILSGASAWKGKEFKHIYIGYLVNCELEHPGFTKKIAQCDEAPYFKHSEKLSKNSKLDQLIISYIKEYHAGLPSGYLDPEDEVTRHKESLETKLAEKHKDASKL